MSVEAMALVLHHSTAKGTDKVILLGIANHAGDGGAWPSIATLARYANVHERNVQRSIEKLVTLGELAVHRQDGGRASTPKWERPNRYDVLVGCPATCDHTAQHRQRALPQAPAALWTEGVAHTPPGGTDATTPVAQTPPAPPAHTPPEPSPEPSTPIGSDYLTGPRASSGTTPTCHECSAPNMDECYRRQRHLRMDDRHRYQAVRRAG